MEPRGRAGPLQNQLPQQRQQNETFQLAPEVPELFPEIILINSAVFLQARLGDLDMSDDDTVPAAPGQIVEVHSDEVDSQSQDSGEAMQVVTEHQSLQSSQQVFAKVDEPEQGAGPRRRRRKAAATADASFSSGCLLSLAADAFDSMNIVQEEKRKIQIFSCHQLLRLKN